MAQRVAQHVMALYDGAAKIRALYSVGHVDDQGKLVADDNRPLLVTHGGVTIDLLRNLFPDAIIRAHIPDVDVTTEGILGGAITYLVRHDTT